MLGPKHFGGLNITNVNTTRREICDSQYAGPRNCLDFKELKSLLLCSQMDTIGLYREPVPSNPHSRTFETFRRMIILTVSGYKPHAQLGKQKPPLVVSLPLLVRFPPYLEMVQPQC